MYEKEITASHPVCVDTDQSYKYDEIAMLLVGERHSKRELVDLVRWLLMGGTQQIDQDIDNKKL